MSQQGHGTLSLPELTVSGALGHTALYIPYVPYFVFALNNNPPHLGKAAPDHHQNPSEIKHPQQLVSGQD